MKKLLLSVALLGSFFAGAQTDVADARTYGTGQTVTVTAVATNGSELGNIRYMQDNTAGIAGYSGPITGVSRGDSITVTGTLIDFQGLLEISPVSNVVNHGQAVEQPMPLLVSISSITESLESQLVQLDNVTFVETGSFATNDATYTVTDGTNTLDIRVNASTDIAGTPIPTGAVSIIAPLGQFNANYQLVPRDLNDIFPFVAPSEEINVLLDGSTVFSGSNYFIGTTSSITVTIENAGTNNLSITGASFSGPDAAVFSTTIGATSVAGLGNQTFTIDYTPTVGGSHFSTLEIQNNDSDENPYIIHFEGVGTDGLATEPTSNPTGLTFPVLEAYTVGGQYSAGVGAANYLVLWKSGSPITSVPVDGETYLRGDWIGDAKVAYMGPGTSFTPRGVIANQDYHFAVYAFNGQGGFENYQTTNPLIGTASSLGEGIGSYYSGIDKMSSTFTSDLYDLINPHDFITYFLYKQTMMNEFEIKDTIGGQSYVTCALSGETEVFSGSFDWTATGYSREHTFSHSWMPTFPADEPEEPEYTDQHNLYPAHLDSANSPRSNLPLDDIDGSIVFSFGGGNVGFKGSQLVYEPTSSHKGNAARAIMYTVVAYNFDLDGNPNSTKQSMETLRNWHFGDLPDDYEIARHEYIYNLQNNRNPFIDSVDYACYVDFNTNTHDADGCLANVDEFFVNNTVVFPVPSSGDVYVQVNGTEITSYKIIDMQGRTVLENKGVNLPVLTIDGHFLENGSYLVEVETPIGVTQKKMIIRK